MKILIIGGVAAGASAATRARRNSEEVDIVLFEKGDYISYANCGLPYHIGNVINDRENLFVMTPESFKKRGNIDVRIKSEVISIDIKKKEIEVKEVENGRIYYESYDKLILSPGSIPFIPHIPGVDDPDVFVLWTIPDMDKIIDRINKGVTTALVIGGGFIGVEAAENLTERGIKTTLIEKNSNILPTFDKEMGVILEEEMASRGVTIRLNTSVAEIKKDSNGKCIVVTDNGNTITSDIVILAIGVIPNTAFLKDSGLKLNTVGGIVTNEYLQTSDPDIYAAGDAVEINYMIFDKPGMVPLAGPANKQGRIVADNILGAKKKYKGSIGTAVCKVFGLTAASVGANEKKLKLEQVEYIKYYLMPSSSASYYPGSDTLYIKMIITQDGRILGSQIIGAKGADKKIDLIAGAIRNNLKVSDLAELEIAYAPPYNLAKDPINFAGFIGENILEGKSDIVHSDNIPEESFLLDVRDNGEFVMGSIAGAVNIPLRQIRSRIFEIPKDKQIVTFCRVGLRGYLAERILKQNGFSVKNLSGGYEVWKLFNNRRQFFQSVEKKENMDASKSENIKLNPTIEINACGIQCPGPILKVKEALSNMKNSEVLKITVNDRGFLNDIPSWCESTGNQFIGTDKYSNGTFAVFVRKGAANDPVFSKSCSITEKQTSIVLFSNDLDKAMAAFIIASGFASLGHKVSIFFTFWGLNVLRKDNPPSVKRDVLSRMFGFMMPRGAKKLALSKMHMMGMGTAMMKHVMKQKGVYSLPELISQAQCLGIEFLACKMAMNVMGITEEELIDGIKIAGVAHFAALSEQSITTLFI